MNQLNLQFVLGYTGEEFAASLAHLAEGRIDVTPLITGHVGLGGVKSAFVELASPEQGDGRAVVVGNAQLGPVSRGRSNVVPTVIATVLSQHAQQSDFSDPAVLTPTGYAYFGIRQG